MTSELNSWKERAAKAEQNLVNLQTEVDKAKAELGTARAEVSKASSEIAKLKPQLPKPSPLTLEPATSALLILDLSNRVNDPTQPASKIAPRVKILLDKARKAGVTIIYTVSLSGVGTPQGAVWDGFSKQPDEPVLAPDAFDKFAGGEVQDILAKKGIKTVIITGASSNFAVLYTATTAARVHGYNVVIPVDGIIARTQYEDDYTLYQFSVLPGGASQRFSFTTIDTLSFKS